jgi:hypothetical protein
MSPRAERPILRNRGAHTVYLSDEIWDALERTYLELRLAGTGRVSKVEFIEATMRAGLDVLSRPTENSPANHNAAGSIRRKVPGDAETSGLETPSKTETSMAHVMTSAKPESGPETPETHTAKPKTGGQTRSGTRGRPSALDRLRQASDPGRPAPIHSVADMAEGFSQSAK